VVQVSLIVISFNLSTHLGVYTLTASNVAGTAAGSIVVRITSSTSASHMHNDDGDDDDDVGQLSTTVLQHPDNGYQQLSGLINTQQLFSPAFGSSMPASCYSIIAASRRLLRVSTLIGLSE